MSNIVLMKKSVRMCNNGFIQRTDGSWNNPIFVERAAHEEKGKFRANPSQNIVNSHIVDPRSLFKTVSAMLLIYFDPFSEEGNYIRYTGVDDKHAEFRAQNCHQHTMFYGKIRISICLCFERVSALEKGFESSVGTLKGHSLIPDFYLPEANTHLLPSTRCALVSGVNAAISSSVIKFEPPPLAI